MKRYFTLAAAVALFPGSVVAQTSTSQQTSQQDRLRDIFGSLFGDRLGGGTSSIDAQWAAGQMPLSRQQSQFQARVDTEVRSGRVDQATAARLKSDYATLVQLETEYGADRAGQRLAQQAANRGFP